MTACGARWCKAVPTSEVRNPGRRQAGVFLFPYSSHPPERGLGHRPIDSGCLRG